MYEIQSDSTSYVESKVEEDDRTDNDLIEISDDKREDKKVVAIFENNYDVSDKDIVALEDITTLNKRSLALLIT